MQTEPANKSDPKVPVKEPKSAPAERDPAPKGPPMNAPPDKESNPKGPVEFQAGRETRGDDAIVAAADGETPAPVQGP